MAVAFSAAAIWMENTDVARSSRQPMTQIIPEVVEPTTRVKKHTFNV